MARSDAAVGSLRQRSRWRAVAIPTEHGGWSLTAEPALLGLLVAWSWAGLALGGAAMLAFVTRTPVKVVLVDGRRHRRTDRTRLAATIAATEMVLLVGLVAIAAALAERPFWTPLAIAAPLVLVELWYDMRSRSRRLIPELAGSIGIGSIAAAVALAGGERDLIAYGLWCVIAARSAAAIPYVRVQISRMRAAPSPRWHSDVAQVAALAAVVVGWGLDAVPLAAVGAIALLGVANVILLFRPPQPAKVIGMQQTLFGLVVIGVTAVAVVAG